jgi:hypothetical protein
MFGLGIGFVIGFVVGFFVGLGLISAYLNAKEVEEDD